MASIPSATRTSKTSPADFSTPRTQNRLDAKVTRAVSEVMAANAANLQIISDLELEVNLHQKAIEKIENRWFSYSSPEDVTGKKSLIIKLAGEIAQLLEKVFAHLASITKTRPTTIVEETEIEDVASRLANAYKNSQQTDKEAKMNREAENAHKRAELKGEKVKEMEEIGRKADEYAEWAKKEHRDTLRSLPVFNWVLWTTEEAKIEVAKWRIRIAQEELNDVAQYPVLRIPKLEKLIEAKGALALLQTSGSVENLMTKREIREFSQEKERLIELIAVEKEIAGLKKNIFLCESAIIQNGRIDPSEKEAKALLLSLKNKYQELLSALQRLEKAQIKSSPEHTATETEIQALKVKIMSQLQGLWQV